MGERTATRPVASGRIAPERALEFGIALSALSFVLLDSLVNLPTALLALAGNLFYVFVYTRWLKRSTPQNIVIGGAAGRRAAARRLRGRGGAPRLGGARHVRDRLPLDAAALLGARADDPGALRERERADAAGRARRPRDGAADRLLHGRARRGDAASRSRSACSGSSTASPRSCSERCFAWLAFRLWRELTRPRAVEALPLLDALPRAALRRDGPRRGRRDERAAPAALPAARPDDLARSSRRPSSSARTCAGPGRCSGSSCSSSAAPSASGWSTSGSDALSPSDRSVWASASRRAVSRRQRSAGNGGGRRGGAGRWCMIAPRPAARAELSGAGRGR